MITPMAPADEALRLETLRSLKVLDTPKEDRFDRVTRLAKRLFNVPIALISLVDENRQWFKSCQGLDASETSRDISFCGHAILGGEILLVEDALLDERFRDNPLVIGEPRIRFYAGCPLRAPNGIKLGTLCIIDNEPRTMNQEDLISLHDLAGMAEQELAAMHMATTDELTSLFNRRGFLMLGKYLLSACARFNRRAWMLYFDLDGFKPINDRFGHAEGDRALATFATLLAQTFRGSDIIGRLGGDEFVVLMTNRTEEESEVALLRFREAINEQNQSGSQEYDLRFSLGLVVYEPSTHPSIDELLAEADTLMYERKKLRR